MIDCVCIVLLYMCVCVSKSSNRFVPPFINLMCMCEQAVKCSSVYTLTEWYPELALLYSCKDFYAGLTSTQRLN